METNNVLIQILFDIQRIGIPIRSERIGNGSKRSERPLSSLLAHGRGGLLWGHGQQRRGELPPHAPLLPTSRHSSPAPPHTTSSHQERPLGWCAIAKRIVPPARSLPPCAARYHLQTLDLEDLCVCIAEVQLICLGFLTSEFCRGLWAPMSSYGPTAAGSCPIAMLLWGVASPYGSHPPRLHGIAYFDWC